MELKNRTSVEAEMNRVLKPLGLKGWEAVWVPDPSQDVDGQVIVDKKVILVFSEDSETARDSFLHEVIEVRLRKLMGNHIDTMNGLIKIIEKFNYIEKERTINELVPLIRHVFDE